MAKWNAVAKVHYRSKEGGVCDLRKIDELQDCVGVTEVFLETGGDTFEQVVQQRTNLGRVAGMKIHDFMEGVKKTEEDLADALLELIANQEESLTEVRESDVLTEVGDLLLADGCVHEQKRRMSEDLALAQKITAEKLANGKKNSLGNTSNASADNKPTPPQAQQVPTADFTQKDKEDMSVEKTKRKADDITATPPKVATIDQKEKKEESSGKKLKDSGKVAVRTKPARNTKTGRCRLSCATRKERCW